MQFVLQRATTQGLSMARPATCSLGEFSVHYAGFFDPGFGFGPDGEIKGTRAVLEVRAHEVPILLEDKQTVGRLNYYKMANHPVKVYGHGIGSSYQQQGLALSKQFKARSMLFPALACPTFKWPHGLGGSSPVSGTIYFQGLKAFVAEPLVKGLGRPARLVSASITALHLA